MWLVVIKGILVFRFRPLMGCWIKTNKRRIDVRYFMFNEVSPLFEYTISISDPPEIYYSGRIRDSDFIWLLNRGIYKKDR